jgi:hypothetical protein
MLAIRFRATDLLRSKNSNASLLQRSWIRQRLLLALISLLIPPGMDGLRSWLVPFYRAARRRATPLVPTLHQGCLVQGLDQADQGSTDDTGHTPASAQEADRSASPARTRVATAPNTRARPRRDTSAHDASSTCRITRRISWALNGLTTDGRAVCVKKAWAFGLNTSPVRKMTRDTRCGWRRSSSR